MPFVELAGNFSFYANKFEAVTFVEGHADRLGANNPGEDGVESVNGCDFYHLSEHGGADAAALTVPVYVDGVFNRGSIPGAVPIKTEAPKTHDFVVSVSYTHLTLPTIYSV